MYSSGDSNDLRCKQCGCAVGLIQYRTHGFCEIDHSNAQSPVTRRQSLSDCERLWRSPTYKGPRRFM